ncbi:nucleotidyltransferase family protein [Hydrogenophaga sp.]|uniref:nucleotidyltransferase domain-containing protein n=1 Tax=Hydrogenophaga sp. TaxID=1904254 RepID=UPI0035B369F3
MSLPSIAPLVAALHDGRELLRWRPATWDLCLRQGRHADVLARLGVAAQEAGVWEQIPQAARYHLEAACKLADRQHTELAHEVRAIARALARIGVPVVLLKGAAYRMAGLRAARGRLVSDVDILVPRERLADVESALMMGGWVSTQHSAYDQRYYRQWMHELPPLRHVHRGSVLDVHHAILPLTNRLKPDSALLLAAAQPVPGEEGVHTLAPLDLLLHSAAHLFHEGELEMGLRGLLDLDALLRECVPDAAAAQALLARAQALQLSGPLALALRYTQALMGTPVPAPLREGLPGADPAQPSGHWLLDALYLRALRPPHPSADDRWTPLARLLLYLRAHALRMPPHLLLPHLARKLLSPAKPHADA